MYGRQFLAKGIEHNVIFPRSNKHKVIKIPRILNRLSFWPYHPVPVLRKELQEARELVADKKVIIPRTQVHKARFNLFRRFLFPGYILWQDTITEDGSVTDILAHLQNEGLSTLAEEFKHEPRNFISRGGLVYWIDPTKGVAGRVLEKVGISMEDWRKTKVLFHKPIRFFRL